MIEYACTSKQHRGRLCLSSNEFAFVSASHRFRYCWSAVDKVDPVTAHFNGKAVSGIAINVRVKEPGSGTKKDRCDFFNFRDIEAVLMMVLKFRSQYINKNAAEEIQVGEGGSRGRANANGTGAVQNDDSEALERAETTDVFNTDPVSPPQTLVFGASPVVVVLVGIAAAGVVVGSISWWTQGQPSDTELAIEEAMSHLIPPSVQAIEGSLWWQWVTAIALLIGSVGGLGTALFLAEEKPSGTSPAVPLG